VGIINYFNKNFGPTAYITDHLGDKMVQHIERSAEAKKPFFAYWAPFAPHWPIDAKTEDMKKYEGVYEQGPTAIATARVARMREMGILEKDMPWTAPTVVTDADSIPDLAAAHKKARTQKSKANSAAYWNLKRRHGYRERNLKSVLRL
jgi:arylsulfatase A-like enzyme